MYRIDRGIIDPKLLELAKQELLKSIERIEPDSRDASIYARQGGIRLASCLGTVFSIVGELLEPIAKFPVDLRRSSGRIQHPCDRRHFAWHQDLTALDGRDGLVAWIPLDALDGSRPTLQIGKTIHPIEHKLDDRRIAVAIDQDHEAIETIVGLEVGDVCWLGPYTMHRTYSTPDMTNPRHSLDMRFL